MIINPTHSMILRLLDNPDIDEYTISEIKKLDFKEFYWQICQHKISNYIYFETNQFINWIDTDIVLGKSMKYIYEYAYYKNRFIINNHLSRLINTLNDNHIPFIIIKGPSVALQFYRNVAERLFGDIDILIEKSTLQKCKHILLENGYVQTADVKVTKYYEMVTHQTSPFISKNKDNMYPIEIDINFSFGSEERLKSSGLIKECFDYIHMLNYNNHKIPTLSIELNLIFLCVHLWRESMYIHNIKDKSDIILSKYLDIAMLIKNNQNIDMNYIQRVIEKFNLCDCVFYSIYHLCEIFPSLLPRLNDFINSIKPTDLSCLDIFGIENKKVGFWDVPFLERIFSPDRYGVLKNKYDVNEFEKYSTRENRIFNDSL